MKIADTITHEGWDFLIYITEPYMKSFAFKIVARLNQKGIRPQDRPVALDELTDEEQRIIRSRYPELD